MIGLLKSSDFNGRLHSLQRPQDKEALYEHFYSRYTIGTIFMVVLTLDKKVNKSS